MVFIEGENIVKDWAHGVKILITKPVQSTKDIAAIPGKLLTKTGETVGTAVGKTASAMLNPITKPVNKLLVPIAVIAAAGALFYFTAPLAMRRKLLKG